MLSWFKRKFSQKNDIEESVPETGSQTAQAVVEVLPQSPVPADIALTPVPELPTAPPPPMPVSNAGREKEPDNLFGRLKQKLSKTRDSFVSKIDTLFLGRKEISAELFDELEEILIMADLGAATTNDLLNGVREDVKRQELSDPQALKSALKNRILAYLIDSEKAGSQVMPASGPFVIMVLGVNGVGKTTTIGKLAYKFKQSGRKVLMVAGDTFRAAAGEQLQEWGNRIGVEVVRQQEGADPSAVIFDAFEYALPRNFEVIIVDTAGRLHTKVNLMEELKKIKRVMDKKIPGAPHEILLVIDATTGQNGISQTRLFHEAVQVTGLALTKLDGTAKGGIVVNICHEFDIPIRFIGIGEKMEDLRDFDSREFVEALFGNAQG
jgi:fused signal recognition particle receptor